MIDFIALRKEFSSIFNEEPRVFRAPGRVNLIGEHTDYNGGFVLPMAIDRESAVAIGARTDRTFKVHTVNFNETTEFNLDEPFKARKGFWLNYVEGVARVLEQNGLRLKGCNMVIRSDVPSGDGLSSSAALEVVAGFAFAAVSDQKIDRVLIAKAGQQTEHEYVGAKVGIMDQFVSANAVKGHALLLDCRSLEFENVPLDSSDAAVVICDTNVKHDIATSEYNTRRQECEEAVEILHKYLPDISQLRDVSVGELEEYGDRLPEIVGRRAKHVVNENDRTLRAAEALKEDDLKTFGSLMWESHKSLRDDYEVSSKELDTLVDIASGIDGVIGARMTGGGFGGSTVNLVRRDRVEVFIDRIGSEYKRSTGIDATILISEPSQGASEIA